MHREPKRQRGISCTDGEVHRLPPVVQLGIEGGAIDPALDLPVLDRVVDQTGNPFRVRPPDRLRLTGLRELLQREGPHRLQEPVAARSRLAFVLHQRLAHEGGERGVVTAHRAGGVGREPAREHAESTQQHPFGVVEQLVRPLQRRPQSLVAVDRTAASRRQQPEPVVEACGDVVG